MAGLVRRLFGRVEVRRTAWSYVEGLRSLVGRKNCWWLAQQAGHPDPGRLQRLLGSARWDADVMRDALLRLAAKVLAVPGGVLVVDETGFARRAPPRLLSLGSIRAPWVVDNCQLAVFLGYATSRVRLLVDRTLYVPKVWADDADRRTKAGVPKQVTFATKPQLALTMIRRAVEAGLAAAWVTADEAHGRAGYFRAGLRAAPWVWATWSRSPATNTSPSPASATASTSSLRESHRRRGSATPADSARKAPASTAGRG